MQAAVLPVSCSEILQHQIQSRLEYAVQHLTVQRIDSQAERQLDDHAL